MSCQSVPAFIRHDIPFASVTSRVQLPSGLAKTSSRVPWLATPTATGCSLFSAARCCTMSLRGAQDVGGSAEYAAKGRAAPAPQTAANHAVLAMVDSEKLHRRQ